MCKEEFLIIQQLQELKIHKEGHQNKMQELIALKEELQQLTLIAQEQTVFNKEEHQTVQLL